MEPEGLSAWYIIGMVAVLALILLWLWSRRWSPGQAHPGGRSETSRVSRELLREGLLAHLEGIDCHWMDWMDSKRPPYPLHTAAEVTEGEGRAKQGIQPILAMGDEAIAMLLSFGVETHGRLLELGVKDDESSRQDYRRKRQFLRKIEFVAAQFCIGQRYRFASGSRSFPPAVDFLMGIAASRLVASDYAKSVLHNMGVGKRELIVRDLLSLPIVDRQKHDEPMALEKTVEKILRIHVPNMFGHVVDDHFNIGSSWTHTHAVFRIGQDSFAYRVWKFE